VLRAVRRRLKRVEIETHLIRADLAQFEAVHETDLAQALRDELEGNSPTIINDRLPFNAPLTEAPSAAAFPVSKATAGPAPSKVVRVDLSPKRQPAANRSEPAADFSAIPTQIDSEIERTKVGIARWVSPAWLLSVAVHFVMLLVCGSLTYAILVDDRPPTSITLDLSNDANMVTSDPAVTEVADVIEVDSPDLATGDGPMNFADIAIAEPLPFTTDATLEPTQGMGELKALPSETGTLMAGLGAEGKAGVASTGLGGGSREGVVGGRGHGGKPGRRAKVNATSFFGTEAVGDRFVFLVDNSGSMKQGRMETTAMELLRCIGAMSKDQSFYIVFYSDEAYPMFYPQSEMHFFAATPENKQRLVPWLQTLELCSGGKMVEAIELAASLRPDAVYILSDGDINSPRTMQKMTEANDWQFVIHTLGMGVKKPVHADNLTAIAQAHHGKFQMVQATPAAAQMAKQHPIKSNPTGVAWGMGGAQRKP
jgi:von Willebrand factor type A domain